MASKIFDDIVICKDISIGLYQKILDDLGFIIKEINSGLQVEKVKVLISLGILQMNENSIANMREYYPTLVNSFALQNIEEYIGLQDSINVQSNEILHILESLISDKKKIELLSKVSIPISIDNKNYSDEVKQYILENNLEASDLEKCFLNYSQFPEKLQSVIYIIAIRYIKIIKGHHE